MMLKKLIALVILGLVVFLPTQLTSAAGGWVDGSASAGGATRTFRLWVPSGYTEDTATPLVMVLHGCTQNPNDIAAGTQFNALADAQNFLVVYPEQPSSANFRQCWNWFETAHQARGAGEPAVLAAVVNQVRAQYNVDPGRVYVTGISAGGAMAVIMGATYPDIFAAVGVVAGVEYKAGTDLTSGVLSLSQGGPDPDRQGLAAYQAMGSAAQRMPVIVFHGSADRTVYPLNAQQVLAQWAQTNDYVDDGSDNDTVDALPESTTNGQVPGGRGYTRTSYNDAAGGLLLEQWIIDGAGHAWPGGSTDGSYTDPQGPDATGEQWRFFTQSGTPVPPTPTAAPTTPTATPTTPPGTTPTVAPPPTMTATATPVSSTSATFAAIGAEDGYTAALTPGGTTGAYALGFDLSVGDSADAPLRGVLSFDTGALPDDATILAAEVRLSYSQAPIGNPWAGLGSLVGDIAQGCLGTSCALAAGDFEAPVALPEAVVFPAPTGGAAGTAISGRLTEAGLPLINRTGPTQFKLRFQNNQNGNGWSDYLILAGGESFNQDYRPVLVVEYR